MSMYAPGDNQPARDVSLGHQIEPKLVPGFMMTVRDIRNCAPGPGREEEHAQYQVADPDGNTDWLCAYDVRKVS